VLEAIHEQLRQPIKLKSYKSHYLQPGHALCMARQWTVVATLIV